MRTLAKALVLLLLLAGCSAPGHRDGGPITLRFQSLAWQQESVAAVKDLVKEWNATHPDVRVEYVQGSWDSVHDQLLTAFEGGEAPDVVHDASDDLADFAYGGHLADLTGLLPPGSSPASRQAAGGRPPSGTASTACPSCRSPGC